MNAPHCRDCEKVVAIDYMVRDVVWAQAFPTYAEEKRAAKIAYQEGRGPYPFVVLCFDCLEKRLGRPLVPSDFDLELPINAGIKLGMRMLIQQMGRSETPMYRGWRAHR